MASGFSKSPNAAEIDRLALVLAKEPGSKAFMPLAEEYGKAGMWQEAAGVLEDGLKAYPNFITAMVALGRTYDQLNQPVKAKAILEEAVKLSPENLRAHRTLAKIYVAQGSKEAALRCCDVILSVNPRDQEALSFRNTVHTASTPGSQVQTERVTSDGPQATDACGGLPGVPLSVDSVPTSAAVLREDRQVSAPPSQTKGDPVSAAAVTRLEAWLAAIQSRRRSCDPPRGSASSS
jgi:tetratricopeptide (TPR) repeat protein